MTEDIDHINFIFLFFSPSKIIITVAKVIAARIVHVSTQELYIFLDYVSYNHMIQVFRKSDIATNLIFFRMKL